MKNKKLNLDKLKVNSFVTESNDEINKTIKGGIGSDTLYDTACQNSFGGPNTLCDTNKTGCEVGQTTRCISVPAILCTQSF